MRTSIFPLSLPDDLREAAAAQAESAKISLNEFIAQAVAARVSARAEVVRYFKERGGRAVPGRAREILARAGDASPPADEDRLDRD